MHFDKLSSPIQALNLYKEAKKLETETLRLNRFDYSYRHSEFLINNLSTPSKLYSDFPPSGSPYD
ncbi:hypothetical protein NQ651_17695, partial [Acinetobacter baumannii]|nr:hypothetical protein [Acinetobacter baumannii]